MTMDKLLFVTCGKHVFFNIAKATRLIATSENRNWRVANRLFYESRDHHPIVTNLPGPYCIEESDNNHWQLVLVIVSKPEEFVN